MNNSPKIVLFPIETKKGFPIRLRYKIGKDYKYINLGFYIKQGERKRYWNENKNE